MGTRTNRRGAATLLVRAVLSWVALGLIGVAPVHAHTSPANCTDNDIAITLSRNKSIVTNGEPVAYTVSVTLQTSPVRNACDATDLQVKFCCPSVNGTPYTTIGPGQCAILSGSLGDSGCPTTGESSACGPDGVASDGLGDDFCRDRTNPSLSTSRVYSGVSGLTCAVNVNAGVTSAQASASATGGKVHDFCDPLNPGFEDVANASNTITVGVRECRVAVDKQISCDGGATYHDVGFAEDGISDTCAGTTGLADIKVRYLATIPDQAGTESVLANCRITESNASLGNGVPGPFGIGIGQTLPFEGTPQLCEQAHAGGEPDTATIDCECVSSTTTPKQRVTDDDQANFTCLTPEIAIKKYTNGQDANDPNAAGVPECVPGGPVTWRYDVTTPGTVPVPRADISVTDNEPGVNPQPVVVGGFVQGDANQNNLLDPGETWIYQATGTCLNLLLPPPTGVIVTPNVCRQGDVTRPGRTAYTNIGRVTIPGATATDPSSYCNPPASIAIKKYTNGQDANDPNAAGVPECVPGSPVTWRYDVTTPGTVPVPRADISVTDNEPGVNPQPVVVGGFVQGDANQNNLLDPGETWIYQATGTCLNLLLPPPTDVIVTPNVCRQGDVTRPGRTAYTNIGRVTIPGATATDPSSYCNPPASIAIRKYTNGQDANDPNAAGVPECVPGSPVTWRYDVTTPGTVPVPRADISVTDNEPGVNPQPVVVGGFVQGDANQNNLLDPGETWIYQATGTCLNLLLPPPTDVIVTPNVCRQGDVTRPGRTAYTNIGRVTIPGATATDPSSYCNPPASIAIRKYTNGQDANDPNAAGVPECVPGSPVTWRYDVTTPGTVPVPRADISVTDNEPGVNPQPVVVGGFVQGDANQNNLLDPGETWIYQATGTCLNLLLPPPTDVIVTPNVCRQGDVTRPGRTAYTNIGRVTIPGATATDPSSYCNPPGIHVLVDKQVSCDGGVSWHDVNLVLNDEDGIGDTCTASSGQPMRVRYRARNDGELPLTNCRIVESNPQFAGLVPVGSIAVGTTTGFFDAPSQPLCSASQGGEPDTATLMCDAIVGGITQQVTALDRTTFDCSSPPPCSLTVTKTCAVPQPPTSSFVCSGAKPLDSITMIWRGAETIGIKAWKGAVGSTLLLTLNGIQPNQEVTVTGYAGSQNDVFWEIFNAGGTKIGNSTFHLSCSDVDMNGPEDCGKPEGDGKGLSGYINLWEFEGMGGNGQVLDCTVTPPTPSTTCDLQDNGIPGCAELGHPTSLTFRYTGGGCAASQNTQAAGKATCTGAINPTLSVTITSTNGYSITPSTVQPGTQFTVSAGSFNAQSYFTLTNSGGSEVQSIHTSCSQPLNVGDIFGSLTLVAFNGQTAGTEVTYAYTIQNTGAAVGNVNLEDDKLGHIAGPLTLAAGASQTFTKVANVSVNTTNIATVTGQIPGGSVCSAQASATVSRPPCPPAHSSIKSDFNGTSIAQGRNIWFSANFKASGVQSGTTTTIHLANSTITFTASGQAFNLPVPDATIVFDPAASCATTTFDAGSNTWLTTVPTSGSDEIFLSGLAFVVPFNFPGGIKPVTWSGDFSVDKAGVSVSWKWGAAVYTTNMTNYNADQVKPAHTNTCQYQNSDHAGTPEAKKAFVVGGARGGGGSNFTGSWSGTSNVALICVNVPQTAAVEAVDTLIFDSDQVLAWSPSLNAAYYDVVRGSIDDLRAPAGTGTASCEFDDLPSVLAGDDETPAAGQCFFYVVRGDAVGPAPGTYDDPGASSRDAQINAGGLNCTHRE